jgi:hypothetical protein
MPYYRCPECGLTTHSVAGYSSVGICASCAAPLPFEAPLHPAAAHDQSQVLRAGLAAPGQARRMVAALPLSEELHDAVHDEGPRFSRPAATNGGGPPGGLGLEIVAALSEDLAVASGPDGCTVQGTVSSSLEDGVGQ